MIYLHDLLRDARLALRALRKAPGFAAAAILSLALGIAAASAIFSVVNAVLLRPLDYADPDRLVVLRHDSTTASPRTFLEWRERARTLDRIGAAEYWSPNLAGAERSERIVAVHATADLLPVLGVAPMLGRVFTDDEAHAGTDRVVVVGYGFWKSRLAADPNAVGTTLTLDGERYTVVGVMPESFRFAPFWASSAELCAPLVLDARRADASGSLRVFARMKADATLPRVRAEISDLTNAIEQAQGGAPAGSTVIPLLDVVVGDVKPALLVLLAASGFVLLVAGVNVAHLQLVRAASRERELAVRSALGASRDRVVRQLITESAVLAMAGVGLGLSLTYAAVRLLVSLAPASLPRIATVSVDGRVLVFATLATLAASLVFGLAPAVRGTRFDVSESLKSGGRGSAGGRSLLRTLLVLSEFSTALMLLAAAALIVRSFIALITVDPGFDPRGLLAVDVSVAGARSAEPALRPQFYQELVSRVRAIPGVESASAINHLPFSGELWRFSYAIEGRPARREVERPRATYRVVLPGYFETLRIRFVGGRDFTGRDTLDAPHVVVVNEALARRQWPSGNAIGARLAAGNLDHPDWCTVVGVVKTVKQVEWSEAEREEMYFPYLQTPLYLQSPKSFATYLSVAVRAPGTPAPFAAINAVVRSLEPGAVVANPTTFESAVASQFVAPRFYMLLVGVFAGVAVVLAAVGIYGVLNEAVSARTREIGVRMALGAGRSQILGAIVGRGMRLAVGGSVIGMVGALGSARYLRTLLFGIEPTDPITLACAVLALIGVAAVASYIPARRAMGVDPMSAVRCE